jgi:hypothetical protein
VNPVYDNRMHEKLETLDGSRSGRRDNAAVRFSDLDQLLQLAEVKTKKLTSPPTEADFNSLLDDLTAISNAVRSVASDLRKRRSR